MRFNVTTRIDGEQTFRKRITSIQRGSLTALQKIGDQQVKLTQQRIKSGKTSPDGQRWAPWAIATLRQRVREGTAGGGLLNRTGQLANSIQYRISDKTLTVYTNTGYGRYLQYGTITMPARPFIGWDRASLNTVKHIMLDAIK
jgi:phage virion morphogenesis protein